MVTSPALDTLKRERPEWVSWLGVLDEVLRDANSPQWEDAVPPSTSRTARVPLLAGAAISLPQHRTRALLDRLLRAASAHGTDAMLSLATIRLAELDCAALFTSSVRHDAEPIRHVAMTHAADPEALQAVVALLPVPFLLACNRRLGTTVPASWTDGYCPICGSWPAFAEIRGIERRRCFRCARCGADWFARALVCPFCETTNHNELATLKPGNGDTQAMIDACNSCHGYVKAFTRLQGCAPSAVMIDDLASVELDMAALEQGYARRPGAGYPVDISVNL
jgi:FdhE protein